MASNALLKTSLLSPSLFSPTIPSFITLSIALDIPPLSLRPNILNCSDGEAYSNVGVFSPADC